MKNENVTCDVCIQNGRCPRQKDIEESSKGTVNPADGCEERLPWDAVE